MTDSSAWIAITDNHSFVLDGLAVTKPFLNVLLRKEVLRPEERKWLLSGFETAADDNDRRRLKMILLYTMLISHPDAYASYMVFQNALLTTKQVDILHRLIEHVGHGESECCWTPQCNIDFPLHVSSADTTPPVLRDQTEPFSRTRRRGSTQVFKAMDKALYVVDIIADQTLLSEVQDYFLSIRTWLSGHLKSVDPQQIEIRLHKASVREERNLIIIYPLLDVHDKSSQWPARGLVRLGEFASREERIPECQVELIPVQGLLHLFSPSCEDSFREDYLGDDSGSHNTGTQSVFKAEDLEYNSTEDLIGSGAFSEVFKVAIPSQSRTAALKVVCSSSWSVHSPSVLPSVIFLPNQCVFVSPMAVKQTSIHSRKSWPCYRKWVIMTTLFN